MPPAVCLQLFHLVFLLATGKIALLVGNNRYQHHPNLMAPVKDVFELSVLLKQLGFQVVSLLDLNKAEMVTAVSRFLQLLGKGVYGKASVYVHVAVVDTREEQKNNNKKITFSLQVNVLSRFQASRTGFSLSHGYPVAQLAWLSADVLGS